MITKPKIMPMAIFLIILSIMCIDTCIGNFEIAHKVEEFVYWIYHMRTSIPRLKQGPHSSPQCHIPEIQQHASLEQCFLWRSTLLGLPKSFKLSVIPFVKVVSERKSPPFDVETVLILILAVFNVFSVLTQHIADDLV